MKGGLVTLSIETTAPSGIPITGDEECLKVRTNGRDGDQLFVSVRRNLKMVSEKMLWQGKEDTRLGKRM